MTFTGMSAILRALRSPGATRDVVAAAPTQYLDEAKIQGSHCLDNVPGYSVKTKPRLLDRGLDHVVHASGSIPVFIFIQALLVGWALLGTPFHGQPIWPIVISDAQAIFSYIFDSFLMRQQLNGYNENLTVLAEVKSRARSTERMLAQVKHQIGQNMSNVRRLFDSSEPIQVSLPQENKFTRCITWSASALGHFYFIIFYWLCIVAWLASGPHNDWSNQWQLDINSATSALMVFIFSFLAILRERHADYIRSCLDAVYRVDALLELQLRRITEDDLPNDDTVIPPLRINGIQRAITYYADVVGTLVGIALLMIVLVVWICIGPAMHFDSNWWLLIGTYAGLIGLNDGFVLRNMQALHKRHEDPQFQELELEDANLLRSLNLPVPTTEKANKHSLSHRLSEGMNRICGHEYTVFVGVLVIIVLLTISSVMHWSETGQLVCNIPPSIIESFFMVILITGHNASDKIRRVNMENLLERRRVLLGFANAAEEFLRADGSIGDGRSLAVEAGKQ